MRPALVLGGGLVVLGLLWPLAPSLDQTLGAIIHDALIHDTMTPSGGTASNGAPKAAPKAAPEEVPPELAPEATPLTVTLGPLRQSPLAPLLVTLAIFLGSLLLAPILLLTTLAAVILGPATGFACALLGAMASAITGFAIGRSLGQAPVRWLANRWTRAARVLDALRDHGLKTVMIARVVPVLLYGLVSIACGAMGLGWRPYLLGTLLGMAPVLAAACLFGEGLTRLVRADTLLEALPIALGLAAILLLARKGWSWVTTQRPRP